MCTRTVKMVFMYPHMKTWKIDANPTKFSKSPEPVYIRIGTL